mmetsp:Transcript_153669/g.294438  ORF Transcript_153669/g.294438 Transcript_153669/m.294438 type:complete len:521 (+) Transcript_153669:58-1620(+)
MFADCSAIKPRQAKSLKFNDPEASSFRAFLAALLGFSACFLAFVLHRHLIVERDSVRSGDALFRHRALSGGEQMEVQVYTTCQPSLIQTALDPDLVLSGLGGQCGQSEAATIRSALDAAGYIQGQGQRNGWVAPHLVSRLMRAVWSKNSTELERMMPFVQRTAGKGKLGALVKFFAWGFPMATEDLAQLLGTPAVDALHACRLLMPCSNLPTVSASAVTMSPVQHTSTLVATDWPMHGLKGMREQMVYSIGEDSTGLAANSPQAEGERVLDLCTGSGVQGIIAAKRGAADVVLLDRNPRALRFAQFNAWLNSVGDVVRVVQGDLREESTLASLQPGFDMLLANPPFIPTPPTEQQRMLYADGGSSGEDVLTLVLRSAMSLLKANGTFTVVTQVANPQQFAAHLCSDLHLRGFSGSIAYRTPTTPAVNYAHAHTRKFKGAGFVEQLENLKANRIDDIASGFIFGWRDRAHKGSCGTFFTAGMKMADLQDVGVASQPLPVKKRPCYWAQWGGRRYRSCPDLV